MTPCKTTMALLLCLFPLLSQWSPGRVQAGHRQHRPTGHTCPKCHHCCELKVEKVDEDRYCWEIETKQICVPRVVFPWQKKCGDPTVNNGAYIKTVRVPKKRDFTCPACKYSWSPKQPVCPPAASCADACDCDDCLSATAVGPVGSAQPAVDSFQPSPRFPTPAVESTPATPPIPRAPGY